MKAVVDTGQNSGGAGQCKDAVKLAESGSGNVKGEVLKAVGLRQATYRAKRRSV